MQRRLGTGVRRRKHDLVAGTTQVKAIAGQSLAWLGALICLSGAADAQVVAPHTCPSGITASITATADDLAIGADSSVGGRQRGMSLGGRTVLDTTFVISVEERRWSWRGVVASLSAGFRLTQPGPGHICAGATVAAERAVLLVRGASGTIRFRGDISALSDALPLAARQPGS